MIIGIIAIAKNFAIGRGGTLPWHHSADLKFFKQTTLGHTVAMGSNTYRSIGKPLPGRMNIVLTRNKELEVGEGVQILTSVEQVAEAAKYVPGDIYIIGGSQVYRSCSHLIDRWIVTDVPDAADDADTFMPEDFLAGFREIGTKDLGDGLKVRVLERVAKVV
jgi:dihydrofolate reductase